MQAGDILRHTQFYADTETGELKAKYPLVLAMPTGGDVVVRLLTSRQHGRPESPPCYHGMPYPSYFLGIPCQPLSKNTWLDLRYLDDLDPDDLLKLVRKNIISLDGSLPKPVLISAMDCAANADDTTRQKSRLIRDALAALR
jgi:hypothetical protein